MGYLGTKPGNQVTTVIEDGAVTSAKIADGAITNADVSASAGIAASKLSGLAAVATSGSASDLTSGTVPTARLGTGTANSTTFLRGDNTWATVSGGSGTVTSVATGNGLQGGTITTSGTLSVACPSVGSVGSYALLANFSGSNIGVGSNFSGSVAPYTSAQTTGGETVQPSFPSGTWRAMGGFNPGNATVCCRVS